MVSVERAFFSYLETEFEMTRPLTGPRVRDRLTDVTMHVLDAIDRDGVMTADGTPHPLLPYLAPLIQAGSGMRAVVQQQRSLNASLGEHA